MLTERDNNMSCACLTADEPMLALVALYIDAFEFEQLLQVDGSETLDTQWVPADLVNFDDFSLADLVNFIIFINGHGGIYNTYVT